MDFAEPYAVLCPTLDGPVLAALHRTVRPLTGREVSRIVTRGSERGVRLVLDRLVSHGLVTQETAGAASLYTLNRDHLAFPAVSELLGLHKKLQDRIRVGMLEWELQPHLAWLFGSAARGTGNTGSDVDVLIVRPDAIEAEDMRWRQQLQDLADSIHRWSGNHASLIEVSPAELEAMMSRDEPIVARLREENIPLVGDNFRFVGNQEMLRAER